MIKKFLIGTFVAFVLLVGVTASAAYDFGPTTLKVGSRGDYVKTLQQFVGASPVDGMFGNMTKAKVMAWQATNGLRADGMFGNMSKAKANDAQSNFPAGCVSASGYSSLTGLSCASVVVPPVVGTLPAGCSSTVGFSPTTGMSCSGGTTPVVSTGPLTGGAGDMSTSKISTDVESNLVEGLKDQKILGFKVTADGSDVAVSNMKISLVQGGTGSSYLDRYISDVSVWMNKTKVATIDSRDFTKDSTGHYSKSIALNNAIVREGTSSKATFYVTVSGISNIDTGDMTATWMVTADNFRFTDATGVILTYSPGSSDLLTSAALDVQSIATAGDVKMAVLKDSSSPVAENVMVSDTGSTDVTMLIFKIKNTGADMTFDSLKFDLTGTLASPKKLKDMIGELSVKEGSDKLGSTSTFSSSLTTEQVTIDLDETYTIKKDSTIVLKVVASINDIDNFGQNDSLIVSYVSDSANYEVASTRNSFNSETGSAIGEKATFFSKGVAASAFTAGTASVITEAGKTVTVSYPITFKVTASGNDYYVLKNSLLATVATIDFADLTASSNSTESGNYWLVSEGQTVTFTTTGVIATADVSASGFVKIALASVKYDTDMTAGSEVTYSFSPANSYETGSVYFTK